jgi:hypothetical protein
MADRDGDASTWWVGDLSVNLCVGPGLAHGAFRPAAIEERPPAVRMRFVNNGHERTSWDVFQILRLSSTNCWKMGFHQGVWMIPRRPIAPASVRSQL